MPGLGHLGKPGCAGDGGGFLSPLASGSSCAHRPPRSLPAPALAAALRALTSHVHVAHAQVSRGVACASAVASEAGQHGEGERQE